MSCVKVLAESLNLKSIPSNYVYFKDDDAKDSAASGSDVSVPIIDISLLSSGTPDQRIKAVEDLGKACEDWGFFMLVHHGIPESLTKAMIDASNEFFNLPEEEKLQYETKHVLDPIRCGTSFNSVKDEIFSWRDYLKVIVHPDFYCPKKPKTFSDHLPEYSQRTREVVKVLIEGVTKSLGLEEGYMERSLQLDSALQVFVANYYPPCPQPELAMGLIPHSDHGLFTLLIQNEVGGLQIQHNGKWVDVNPLPNSILVNTGDHLEIFSNGKYKSVLHRAAVNHKKTRISLAIANGPSLESIVRPAPALLDSESSGVVPTYSPVKYGEYLEYQQGNSLNAKACVDRLKTQE